MAKIGLEGYKYLTHIKINGTELHNSIPIISLNQALKTINNLKNTTCVTHLNG